MLGMGFGWNDEYFLLNDGRIGKRSWMGFGMAGKGADSGFAEAQASYRDTTMDWDQAPAWVREQFSEHRWKLLGHDATGIGGVVASSEEAG